MFCEEKKSKCPKENFQSVKRGKMFKYRISGVRKKRIERKVLRKDFWMEILLSSCSLVGFFCEKEMFLKFEEKSFGCVLPR